MTKNVLINYANGYSEVAQKLNSKSGMEVGGFDKVISYSPKDLDWRFWFKNRKILTQKPYGGYALWKPYIILKTLKTLSKGDTLFYCDAGALFVAPVTPLLDVFKSLKQDIMPFELGRYVECFWTKRDAFILMKCDIPKFAYSNQRLSGYSLWRASPHSISFAEEWLDFIQDARIVTDIDNQCGKDNYPGFRANRHDQTVFSLLTKKHQLEAFRNPSEYGNDKVRFYPNSPYGQIISATRMKNKSRKQNIKRYVWRKLRRISFQRFVLSVFMC